MNKILGYILLITTIIFFDQLTKYAIVGIYDFKLGESFSVIDGFFSFTYVRNPGAAFGFLANAPDSVRAPLFLLIPVLASIWLIWLIWKTYKVNFVLTLAYALIFAGAVGNLIDRFRLDYVIDFLDFYVGNSHFPAFNIADSSITIAAGLLILDLILQAKIKHNERKEEN